MTHCTVRKGWVSKTRPGLPNHALAELCYANLELAGPPAWDEEAREFCREIQRGLGLAPMDDPILPRMSRAARRRRTTRRSCAPRSRPGRRTTPPTTTRSTRGMRRPPASTSAAACSTVPAPEVRLPGLGLQRARRPSRPRSIPPSSAPAATIGGTIVDLLTRPGRPSSGRRRSSASARAAASAARAGLRAAASEGLRAADPLPLAGVRHDAPAARSGGFRWGPDSRPLPRRYDCATTSLASTR